ncbi:MAG: tyrC [candidate division NC10 bacterium]|nr:tyrC [candidate division NC10 bacterium]
MWPPCGSCWVREAGARGVRMSGHENPFDASPLFRQMTVVGVGLIGGSLALAAKQAGAVQTVVGVGRSEASRAVARSRGLTDRLAEDLVSGVRGADLVVLAVPVREIVRLLPEVAPLADPACVVTDVGSVKGPILAAGDVAFPDGRFVASHPIAGKEQAGPAAARADLFRGANWILTPGERTRPAAAEKVAALWRAVGARVLRMEAGWHDEVFATVSHLPHLAAYALMDAVLATERGGERIRFSAGGLRDFTRVAGSDPVMWRDIFLMNREPVLKVLAGYQEALELLAAAIRDGDGAALEARLLQARVAREELVHRS